jgi:hypothetical protein
MDDRGFIYVAGRSPRFLCEAINSAETLKALHPTIPVALFTDMKPLFGQRVKPFDKVLPLEPGNVGVPNEWAQGLLVKVRGMARSPFKRTLFLDTDTRILGDLSPVFDLLSEYAIAAVPCTPETSMSCKVYGPMFNSGVIAYRDEKKIRTLFRKWEDLQRQHMKVAAANPPGELPYLAHVADPEMRQFLLVTDQLSLARYLSPTVNELGLALKILDDTWNLREDAMGDRTDVRIHHADCYKVDPRTVEDFLRARGMID